MEQVSREHEAAILIARSKMVTRHVHLYGAAMGLQQQLLWMGYALASARLAEALTLPPTVFTAEDRRAS